MTTSVPQPNEQPVNATNTGKGEKAAMSPHLSASQPMTFPPPSGTEKTSKNGFFYFEGDERLDEDEPLDELGPSFVAPFQASDAMPTVARQAQPLGQDATVPPVPDRQGPKTRHKRWLSLPLIAIPVGIVVIVGLLGLTTLAQATPALQTHEHTAAPMTQRAAQSQQKPMSQPPAPTKPSQALPAGQPQATTSAANWVPQTLPNGWTQAGLSTGDAIQALRTATTFTDREMSLDYRSVGTRANHAGTFTAATFLLTPGGEQRFLQNDVRAINNTLFDQVEQTQLIRLVIDPQPRLVTFAEQGQQQFAWVSVTFR